MRAVRVLSAVSRKTETLFTDIQYQTKTWAKPRRLIVKAEVVRFPDRPARDNDRYVVTNLTLKPERVYKIYRARGDMENRIKELHHDLEVDRTSCTDFKANQFRVLLTAAAYVLMQELRFRAAGTELATALDFTQDETYFYYMNKTNNRIEVMVKNTLASYAAYSTYFWNRIKSDSNYLYGVLSGNLV